MDKRQFFGVAAAALILASANAAFAARAFIGTYTPNLADPAAYAKKFTGKYAHRLITGGIGHNLPQEAPQAFVEAIVDVDRF